MWKGQFQIEAAVFLAYLQFSLTWINHFYVVLNMKEVRDIEFIQVCWILKIMIKKKISESSTGTHFMQQISWKGRHPKLTWKDNKYALQIRLIEKKKQQQKNNQAQFLKLIQPNR